MRSEHAWQRQAHCRSHRLDWFFPAEDEHSEERKQREAMARALCGSCPVRAQCLDMALNLKVQHGVWGGLNERERRRIHRRSPIEHGS